MSTAFDTDWDKQAATSWKDRYEHYKESGKRAEELQAKREAGKATREELIDLVQIVSERGDADAALGILEESARKFPDVGSSWYNLAYLKPRKNDDAGLSDLEKAVELDNSLKYDAASLAFDYLRSKGRIDEARKYAALLDEQAEEIENANKERSGISVHDEWEPHDLPQEEIAEWIRRKLAGFEEVRAIYIVHKKVKHLPEHPFRVLFVEIRPQRKEDAEPAEVFRLVVDRLADDRIHYYSRLDGMTGDTDEKLFALKNARVYFSPD